MRMCMQGPAGAGRAREGDKAVAPVHARVLLALAAAALDEEQRGRAHLRRPARRPVSAPGTPADVLVSTP